MLRCHEILLGAVSMALLAACSSSDPGALVFSAARGPRGGTPAGPVDGGTGAATPTSPPPTSPPSSPPPIGATDASAGDGPAPPPPDDAGPPPDPTTSCGAPKCAATSDGCGCVADTANGDQEFLGCDDQGCVCGQGQTVDQQLAIAGACDSDAAMLAAWAMCTCP